MRPRCTRRFSTGKDLPLFTLFVFSGSTMHVHADSSDGPVPSCSSSPVELAPAGGLFGSRPQIILFGDSITEQVALSGFLVLGFCSTD